MLEINKIYQMDCMEGLSKLEDKCVQFIFEDPPYNLIGLDVFMDLRIYLAQVRQRAKTVSKNIEI